MKKEIIVCVLSIAVLLPNTAGAFSRKKIHTNSNHTFAETPKTKKDRTVLGTTLGFGSLGAITAGVFGGGQWVPLGLVGGTLAGWAIGKAVKQSKNNKKHTNNHVVRNRNKKKGS